MSLTPDDRAAADLVLREVRAAQLAAGRANAVLAAKRAELAALLVRLFPGGWPLGVVELADGCRVLLAKDDRGRLAVTDIPCLTLRG